MRFALIKKSKLPLGAIYSVSHEKQQTSVLLNKRPIGKLNKYKAEARFLSTYSLGPDVPQLRLKRCEVH